MLGPMVNPASPKFQLVGVYSLEMARVYNYLLQQGNSAFTIIHGLDGYDEISLTNDTKVITNKGERIMTPEQLGKRAVTPADIYGGSSVEEAARLFTKILKGEGSWAQNAVVLANAAMALHCTGNHSTYEQAYAAAVDSLESGKANSYIQKTDRSSIGLKYSIMNILDTIIAHKRTEVAARKAGTPAAALEKLDWFQQAGIKSERIPAG